MRKRSGAARAAWVIAAAMLFLGCSEESRGARGDSVQSAPRVTSNQAAEPSASRRWHLLFRNEASGDPDLGDALALASDVAVNSSGHTMVVGNFSGVLELAHEHVGDEHRWMETTSFAVVLDPSGQRSLSWHAELRGVDPTVTSVGEDFLLAVSGRGEFEIGGRRVSGSASSGGTLVRLATDGQARWATSLNASDSSQITTVATDTRSIWVAGHLRGTSAVHPALAAEAEGPRTFLLRLDPASGEARAAAILTSPTQVGVHTIAPQADGGAIVLGDFHDSMTVGDEELEGERLKRAYLARFGSDGELAWVHRLGDTASFVPEGLAAHPDGSVSVFGTTSAALTLGESPIPIDEGRLGLGVSAEGALLWSAEVGMERLLLRDVAAIDDGNVLLLGAPNAPPSLLEVSLDGTPRAPRPLTSEPLMIPAAFVVRGGELTVVSNTEQVGVAGEIRRSSYRR